VRTEPTQPERTRYSGWERCYRLSNGLVELVATADVGPRVIHFGALNGPNQFYVQPDELGRTGDPGWRLYGGHRLWQAPEDPNQTYASDNAPVSADARGGRLRLTQPVDPTTGIRKEIELRLAVGAAVARVTHRLHNAGTGAVELAPWAITVMAGGGRALLPLPKRASFPDHIAPTSALVLWPYTELNDPRWRWGKECISLEHDPQRATPQKVGIAHAPGWIGYARDGWLFLKTFEPDRQRPYPDYNSCIQAFVNGHYLEIETLGPLVRLAPGEAVEHVEHWRLFSDVPPLQDDADVARHVWPKLAA